MHHLHANPLRVVSIADPALDHVAMALLDGYEDRGAENVYIETRDPSLVREKPGQRLVWFELGLPPRSVGQSYVYRGASIEEQYERAFCVAVQKICDYRFSEDGPIETREPTGEVTCSSGRVKAWTLAELDQADISLSDRWEIGSVAYARFFRRRGNVEPLLLPLTCAVERMARTRLHADAIRAARETKLNAGTPNDSTTTSDEPSDKPGAATATGEAIAAPAD